MKTRTERCEKQVTFSLLVMISPFRPKRGGRRNGWMDIAGDGDSRCVVVVVVVLRCSTVKATRRNQKNKIKNHKAHLGWGLLGRMKN